jgi:proteasome lid subunit RPN8/RPN11
MTNNLIQLQPALKTEPRRGYIPYKFAHRWRSPHEGEIPRSHLEIFMTQAAFVRACAHAGSDLDNEVGGWLVGKWRVDRHRHQEYIVIEKILPAAYTRGGKAYLTFTQDSQVDMHAILEERYPGKVIVGWYHTHPRMGIFMSRYDTWLHSNFFQQPWQVALVIEPHTSMGGFFIPDLENQMDPYRYYGFYELSNRNGRSVVHWENMSARDPDSDGGS